MSGALRPVARKRLYEQVIDRLRMYAAEEACGGARVCLVNESSRRHRE